MSRNTLKAGTRCGICGKEYKGKVGVGVHLRRSHTKEERGKLYLEHVTGILPTIFLAVFLIGAINYLRVEDE